MSVLFEESKSKLINILTYASVNCLHYKETLSFIGDMEELTSDLLEQIPLLNKRQLIDFPEAFRDQTASSENIYTVYTSGTTGFPLRYDRSQEDKIQEGLILNELRYAYGVPRNPIVAMYGLHKEPLVYMYNGNRKKLISLSLHHIDDQKFMLYYHALLEFKVDILQGYASVLYEFAQFISRNDLEPLSITLVENRSEHLQKSQVELISQHLGKVSNMYGSTEIYPMGYTCTYGTLHVSHKNAFIEVIDPKTAKVVPVGHVGEIIVTSLTNKLTPIIRYRTGDIGKLVVCDCPCGKKIELQLMYGRTGDLIKTPYGTLNSVVLRRLFDHFGSDDFIGVGELQMVQVDENRFTLNLVEVPNHTNVNLYKNLIELLRECLGYPVMVEILKVDHLDRDPITGKCQPFISKMG